MENLAHKTQLQEVELERTAKQLKEAIVIAGEETAKCKAAKEVIKSLTAQVRLISSFISMIDYGFASTCLDCLYFWFMFYVFFAPFSIRFSHFLVVAIQPFFIERSWNLILNP